MKNTNIIRSGIASVAISLTSFVSADLKDLAISFIAEVKNQKDLDYEFTNVKKSAAYNGGFSACPIIKHYNPLFGHLTSIKLSNVKSFNPALFNGALQNCDQVTFFVAIQDYFSASTDSISWQGSAPSLKPQHWLMAEFGDKNFNYKATYAFSCAAGLFNTGICNNVVSSPNNQIAIGQIAQAPALTAHEWAEERQSMLSGNVLNFNISNSDKLCVFFSVVRVTDEKLTNKRGAAVTLHIILPSEDADGFFINLNEQGVFIFEEMMLSLMHD